MPNGTRFPVVITFRINEAALARIVEAADGVSPALFCRALVLRAVDAKLDVPKARRSIADPELLRRLLGEFARQGSLLNQIARRANSGASTTTLGQNLAAMRDAYEAAVTEIAAALGAPRAP